MTRFLLAVLLGGCVLTPTDKETVLAGIVNYVPVLRVKVGTDPTAARPEQWLTADAAASGVIASPGGHDWVREISIKEGNEGSAPTCDLLLTRAIDRISLSPTVAGSRANVYNTSPLPALDVGRTIWVESALVRSLDDKRPTVWRTIFVGQIFEISWESDPIRVSMRSLPQAIAMDTCLEDEWIYGAGADASAVDKVWTWEPGVDLSTYRDGEIDYVAPTEADGYVRHLKTSGTTGDSEPAWSTTGDTTDGTAVWELVAGSQWSGRIVDEVIQQIADHASLTIYGSHPSWDVLPWKQERQSVWEAMRAVALQSGYDLIVRHGQGAGGNEDRITWWNPGRGAAEVGDVDWTYTTDQWRDITQAVVRLQDVRNAIRVIYSAKDSALRDSVDYPRKSVTVEDAASIASYGRRFAELVEASTSQIDTSGEATTLANAVVADLAYPAVDYGVTVPFSPWLEIGDVVALAPDGVRFDTDIYLYVVGLEHSLRNGTGDTRLTGRIATAGGSSHWQQRIARPGSGRPKRIIVNGSVLASASVIEDHTKISFVWPPNAHHAILFSSDTSGFSPGRRTQLDSIGRLDPVSSTDALSEQYLGLWGSSDSDIWAVGKNGLIRHWDGIAWRTIHTGVLNELRAVHGSGPSDVWFVGEMTIAHWDGVGLSFASGVTDELYGVYASSASNAWAIGDDSVTIHWDGSSWTRTEDGCASGRAIAGSSASDIWTVGLDGETRHWTGAAWSDVDNGSDDLFGLWVLSSSFAVAVGDGVLKQWTGAAWSLLGGTGLILRAVDGISSTDIWSVGDSGQVAHTTGAGTFAEYTTTGLPLRGVYVPSEDNLWAVGDDSMMAWHFVSVQYPTDPTWLSTEFPADFFWVVTSALSAYYRIAIYDVFGNMISLSGQLES